MRHSKRPKLSCEDVNNALRLRNLETLYGYSTESPQPFVRAVGAKDLFFVEDRELEFNEIINGPLPKCPRDSTLTAHWLAVEGVQPAIPQNPAVPADEDSLSADKKRKISSPSATSPTQTGTAPSAKVKVKPLVKHVISQELQVYYDKITAAFKGTDQELIDGALQSLTNDPGLHQLLPYFVQFVSDEVLFILIISNSSGYT
jgi:transcription initiation factor TFIID subunit 6